MSDTRQYRDLLTELEPLADDQPWADQRQWRTRSHVGTEGGVTVVDLHDLGAKLARRAVRQVLTARPTAGAVIFVHGRGRHTLGAGPVLKGVVTSELRRATAEDAGVVRPLGAARTAWIADPEIAPRSVRGGMGLGARVLLALLVLALVVAVAQSLGLFG